MRGDEVKFCVRCTMPSTRPRIEFDADGVCSACRYHETKAAVDWDERRREFAELLKENPGDGQYDCIVPWSGGKDSSAVALRLKLDYGLNPLLVTYSPMAPTRIGDHNREAMLRHGFDNVFFRPNQEVSRTLARRFLIERGNCEVHRAAGINALPVQEAVRRGIKLVVFAEHGESEYGGLVLSEEHRKFRFFDEVLEHQIGDHPLNWAGGEISERDLAPYLYPDLEAIERAGVKATYFGYWHRWDVRQNLYYVESKIDFRRWPGGRCEGTWSDYDSLDDFMDMPYFEGMAVKFSMGRALRDAARAIQNGHMTIEEAIPLIQAYDFEPPRKHLPVILDYLRMSEPEYIANLDKHRNQELWKFEGNQWRPKFPLTLDSVRSAKQT